MTKPYTRNVSIVPKVVLKPEFPLSIFMLKFSSKASSEFSFCAKSLKQLDLDRYLRLELVLFKRDSRDSDIFVAVFNINL